MNFRQLLDAARSKGLTAVDRPRPMSAVAEDIGVTDKHLYNLVNGTRTAPVWTVARIAKGLGLEAEDVQAALDKTATEVGLA